MNDYESLIKEIKRIEFEMLHLDYSLDFFKDAHKQHVFKYLANKADELSCVNMYLLWDAKRTNDVSSGVYQVQVLDERPVFQYDIDVYHHHHFFCFKQHFEKVVIPYVLKKRQMLELEATLKPKLQTKARLKI